MTTWQSQIGINALTSGPDLIGRIAGAQHNTAMYRETTAPGSNRSLPREWARLTGRRARTGNGMTGGSAWRLTPNYETLARDVLRLPEAAIVGATAFAAGALFGLLDPARAEAAGPLPLLAGLAALLWPFVARRGKPEQPGLPMPALLKAAAPVPAIGLLFVLVALIGTQTAPGGSLPLGFLAIWASLVLPCLLAAHALFTAHLALLRRVGTLRERVGVVWCDGEPDQALDQFGFTRPDVEVAGLFHASASGRSNHQTIDDLIAMAGRAPIDRVIVVANDIASDRLAGVTGKLKALDVDVLLICPAQDAASASVCLDLVKRPLRGWDGILKSLEDRLIALLLLPVALPVMALIALAIRLDTKGPALFRQSRHGRNNTEFQIFKFRTMEWRGAGHTSGARQTARNDARITRVGRFLRASSLDELPQILNILKGDMSIVGPRPHPVMMRTEDRLGHEITPDYAQRHRVKPGLTGLAQINGSRGAMETVEQVRHRVEYDLRYIDNWSLTLDLAILAITPIRLLWHGGKAF